ncbi:MAG: replicative DNA helicase [Myxococcota bacterium]
MTAFHEVDVPAPEITLPHSVEAEREVLAAVFVDPASLDTVLEHGIRADDFYLERHQLIFGAMLALHEADGTLDEVTLAQKMKDSGHWERIGGARTLANLLDRAGTTANLGHYCKIVHDKAQVRRMIEAARTIEAEGLRGATEIQEYLDQAERQVFSVLEQRSNTSMRDMADVIPATIRQIQSAYDADGQVTGLGTGFIDLDKLTSGLQPGDLVIIAARPAMGKTSFVLNLAGNASLKHDASVALFSLEMPSEQLAMRLIAAEARIDLSRLRGGRLLDEDWPRLTHAADKLSQARIFMDDTPGATPAAVRARCRRVARQHGLDLIIIDYLQLMELHDSSKSREQQVSYISRSLKGLAKDLGVPVIALSQMNRGIEKRGDARPMLSDLRESGAIEQDADIIGFIHREEVLNKDVDESLRGVAELIIAKHRNGPIGSVKMKFWQNYTRFDNLAMDHE